MTLIRAIAEFAVNASVPVDVRSESEAAVIDCLGCILAGGGTKTVQALSGLVQGSSGSATLLGQGRTTDARSAALINGTAGHALDYDDINWNLYGHPSTVLVPTLLAVAETDGVRSGAAFLEAFAIGLEVAAKLGCRINPGLYLRGWHATSALGVLGAAAAAARLMGLDVAETSHALAIAASQAAGVRENFGTMVKPLHAGRASEAAVLSAQLARAGFVGSEHALDGRFGYFAVLATESAPGAGDFADLLGAPWEVTDPGIVLKRYPSCGATHCALDGLLGLRDELGFTPEEVERIRCGAESLALKVLPYPRPRTGLEGKFSMEFCLALGAAVGAPRLEHFTERWVSDPAIRDLLPRISLVEQDDLGGSRNDAVPAHVEVVLRDGRRAERTVRVPSGDPRSPMPRAERQAKFMDCATPLLGTKAEEAWNGLAHLGDTDDLPALVGLMSGTASRREAAYV